MSTPKWTSGLAHLRSLLTAALGSALVDMRGKPVPKEIQLVRQLLDNWKGIGHVVGGVERQGDALSLTKMTDDGGRVTFHSNPQLRADGSLPMTSRGARCSLRRERR